MSQRSLLQDIVQAFQLYHAIQTEIATGHTGLLMCITEKVSKKHFLCMCMYKENCVVFSITYNNSWRGAIDPQRIIHNIFMLISVLDAAGWRLLRSSINASLDMRVCLVI